MPLNIVESVIISDLLEFNLGDLNVILEMKWLSHYKANINCEVQKVVLKKHLGKLISYRRFGKPKNFGVIAAMQVRKLFYSV